MDAMILAAGHGQRLRPLTDHYPKPLLPLNNQPMIQYCVDTLRRVGVRQISINLHHLSKKLMAYLSQHKPDECLYHYSLEAALLGTGGGIEKMLPTIESPDFFCMNGDTPTWSDLTTMETTHHELNSCATMLLKPASSEHEMESKVWVKRLAPSGTRVKVVSIIDKPEDEAAMACHFTGVHIFNKDFLKSYSRKQAMRCIIREGYQPWLHSRQPIFGQLSDEPLLDTGTLERYLHVHRLFLQRYPSGFNQHYKDCVHPPVLIDDSVTIAPDCQIGPYVAIGANCKIGKSVLIKNCILLPGCQVEAGTILQDNVYFPEAGLISGKGTSPAMI